ncbi:MAG: glycosyltransferase family 32 protein [Culicoidibacterales bacterium]
MRNQYLYYCWFGRQALPKNVQSYIAMWHIFFPDFEIIEINEDNFDVNAYAYAKTAYATKKYAFVSDVARIHFLQETGGVYLDTDVEVLNSFDELLLEKHGVLFSMEYYFFEITGVNTATILSNRNQKIWADLLQYYELNQFENKAEPLTINQRLNKYLEQHTGFQLLDKEQSLTYKNEKIAIIPSTRLMRKGKATLAIHHLEGTWQSKMTTAKKIRRLIGIICKKVLGRRMFEKLWLKEK